MAAVIFSVIPGSSVTRSPGSIFTEGGYGFRTCRGACHRAARLRAGPLAAIRNDRLHPGPRRLGLRFEAVDLTALLHGDADLVEAVEQRVLAVRFDVELNHAAVRPADFLLLQVDDQRRRTTSRGLPATP